jgi:hypothetical protein
MNSRRGISKVDGIELAHRVIFATADPKLATTVPAKRLRTAVKIDDLRNLDADKLRANSEELVALLQMAAPNHGEAFRQAHAGHLGFVERRIMGAMTVCRTAALGGPWHRR